MDKCYDERVTFIVLADLNKEIYCKGCACTTCDVNTNIIAIACGNCKQKNNIITLGNAGCFDNDKGHIYIKATDDNLLKIMSRIKDEKLRSIIKDIIKTGRKDFKYTDFKEE